MKKRGRGPAYPWETTKPGEHFFVPRHQLSDAASAACYHNRKYGTKFRARMIEGKVAILNCEGLPFRTYKPRKLNQPSSKPTGSTPTIWR